ncbi:hypothetical protein ElyMa_006111400 [Elysia marginata]|uniref:Uncharacterized protein n=1 Tax=Elysia marginata TaxID=1093978 RepID=A0AAV4GX34_9GAST|nr:hypothetical protein ElyMa_006111400 [Elysia marginata]
MWNVLNRRHRSNQKVLQVVMRTQRIKRWNNVEQSIRLMRLTNPVTAQKERPKDLDTGVDGNKQSHGESQDFEVSGGFGENQESEDTWERELPCDLMEAPENFSPSQKEKTELCQR